MKADGKQKAAERHAQCDDKYAELFGNKTPGVPPALF